MLYYSCKFVNLLDPPCTAAVNKYRKIFQICPSLPLPPSHEIGRFSHLTPYWTNLVVSIAKRDGTLLDASSILEEDIVELCIGRAHTCPLGVLWYSTVDSVVFLSSATDVNRTQRALLDITEFGDESITIRTVAPTEVQITTFQAMWHSNPMAGTGELHTPPYQTPPNEETPCRIHAQLGDLNDQEL